MAEITVNGRIKIITFQKSFVKEFPYLVPTLRTDDGKGIDHDMTIAGARSKVNGEYSPSGEADLSVNGNLTVKGFENRFEKAFGVKCEICYQKSGRLQKTNEKFDDMTLATANKTLKEEGGEVFEL
ncbi:MAG: hypothetical protein RJA13_966 [Bacteroidota bacterium]|jgi:hypothetical protein